MALRNVGHPLDLFTAPGLYDHQLRRYLGVFDVSRILVVDQRDLLADRRKPCAPCFASSRWTTIPPHRSSGACEPHRDAAAHHSRLAVASADRGSAASSGASRRGRGSESSGRRRARSRSASAPPAPSAELLARLEEAFATDAAAFRRLTGRDFASWQV